MIRLEEFRKADSHSVGKVNAPTRIRTWDPRLRRTAGGRDGEDTRAVSRQNATAISTVASVRRAPASFMPGGDAQAGTIPEGRRRFYDAALVCAAMRRPRGYVAGPETLAVTTFLISFCFAVGVAVGVGAHAYWSARDAAARARAVPAPCHCMPAMEVSR